MLRFSGLPAKPSYSALFPLRCIEKQAEFRLKRPSCAQAADRRLRRVLKASLAKPASSITIDDLTRACDAVDKPAARRRDPALWRRDDQTRDSGPERDRGAETLRAAPRSRRCRCVG